MLDVGDPVGAGEEENCAEDEGEEGDRVEKIRHVGRVCIKEKDGWEWMSIDRFMCNATIRYDRGTKERNGQVAGV